MKSDKFVLYVCFALLLLIKPIFLYACDDTVLALISGKNPTDECASALLGIVRTLQKLASAIDAFDSQAAKKLIEKVMADWLAFTNRYRVTPPGLWAGDSRWDQRITQISELLGKLRIHFDSGRPSVAHDIIEGLATQMTLLSTKSAGVASFDPLLEAEWDLLNLNPALPENDNIASLSARIATFRETIIELKDKIASDSEKFLVTVIASLERFKEVCMETKSLNSPMPIRAYANLMAAFVDMRSSALAKTLENGKRQ